MTGKERYMAAIGELEAARVAAGGELSQEEESAFVERLDVLWAEMDVQSQIEVNIEAETAAH